MTELQERRIDEAWDWFAEEIRMCVCMCVCAKEQMRGSVGTYVYGAAYVISDPRGDPGIRSHHTGLSTPTTVRTGLHYAFSNDPACTTHCRRL